MKKIFVLLFMCACLFTGCAKEEVELENRVLKDETTGVSISISGNIKSEKLIVKEVSKDYSKILKTDRYKVYDISLSGSEKINKEIKVNLTIPTDFSRERIKVYNLKDNKIKKEYDIEINKDRVSFYTKDLSKFALVEVKGE